jgi:CDP-diacylglycerol---glycerol-3-phosphate 3-phosphatidyltransferase
MKCLAPLVLFHLFIPAIALTSPSKTFSLQSQSTLILRAGSSEGEITNDSDLMTTTMKMSDTNSTPSLSEDKSVFGPNAPPPGFLRKTFPKIPWHSLPNALTFARCLAIPALVVLFYRPDFHLQTSLVFALASFTDWLDGYFARRWDITSPFGAFLDPVADKLMVSTALILLSGRYGSIIAVPTSIILSRELAVSALREWMAQRGQRDSVKVGFQGKVKTAATMVALTILLLVPQQSNFSFDITFPSLYSSGLALLYLSTLVTVTSGSAYFQAAAPALLGKLD